MVYPMLINSGNKLQIVYKQNININRIKANNKTYSYKEVNIPMELVKYWYSITKEELKDLCYVKWGVGAEARAFLTPGIKDPFLVDVEDVDLSTWFNVGEVVHPDRIIPISVRKRGNSKNPKYFIRLHPKWFKVDSDYVEFFINPYLKDPILDTMGLVDVGKLVIL